MTKHYWHLNGMDLCDLHEIRPTTAWIVSIGDKLFCPDCGCRRQVSEPINLEHNGVVPEFPLCTVKSYELDYIHRDLIAAIGINLFVKDFYMGNVLMQGGRVDTRYQTFVTKREKWIIRGRGTRSYYGKCEVCRADKYFPKPVPGRYLIRGEISDASLMESSLAQLVVSKEIKEKIPQCLLTKLFVEKIEVLDRPLDGAPAHLRCVAWE